MKKEDFGPGMKDYGLAIERFKANVKEGKVFLIVNLNDVSAIKYIILRYPKELQPTDCPEWSSCSAHNMRYLQPHRGGCCHLPYTPHI